MRGKYIFSVLAILCVLSSCKERTVRMKSSPDSSSDVYGVVTDNRGHRLQGVVVSDGYSCTITDRNGEYQLSSNEYSTQVNISIPEAYEVPMSEGVPCFWQDLVSGQERYDFTLTPLAGGVETEFNLICIADPQCRYDYQVVRFESETVPDIAAVAEASDIPCYGVALGDIGYNGRGIDVSPIFPMMKERFGKTRIPIFAVMGNHDNSDITAGEYSVAHDIDAQRFFENLFGPVNYSFNRGNAHIICMDDILFTHHKSYQDGFRDDQIEWLKQDLSYVPKDKLLILCVHSPLVEKIDKQNIAQLFEILSDFTDYYHVMSGHWHNINNFVYDSHYEHNQGAGMGSFWTCDICPDGTPNGYAVYKLSGSEIVNWYYKGTGCNADYQIRLYRAGDVFMPGVEPNYQFACTGEDQIVASVFNADANWIISVYEDGVYSGDMEKLKGHDAWASGYLVGVRNSDYCENVSHLFYYTLKNKDAQVEVRATDPFGNIYTQSVFTSNQPEDYPFHEPSHIGSKIFYSDSLNALARTRPYPVPYVEYTPAPRGYKPVYISSYARHGSRNPDSMGTIDISLNTLTCADSVGCLTPLGREVLEKIRLIKNGVQNSLGELTLAGVSQHKGIAERMYLNYPNVFSHKGTPVRLYSTTMQRTMFSMFACNEVLLKHNPSINSTRQASSSLTFLNADYDRSQLPRMRDTHDFVADYFDSQPVLDRLFTGNALALRDTVSLLNSLYDCGTYVRGLNLSDADFIWDLFTMEELFVLQQAMSYHSYLFWSNSPMCGNLALPAMRPLLKDFMDRADTALGQKTPGADLRFGHDIYLMSLLALIGVNGYVKQEEDPMKVVDTFQDFIAAPMAGNLQMVFYRNRSGDVLVKFLQNEVESWIPIDTDLYPYYRWDDVRNYFCSLIED